MQKTIMASRKVDEDPPMSTNQLWAALNEREKTLVGQSLASFRSFDIENFFPPAVRLIYDSDPSRGRPKTAELHTEEPRTSEATVDITTTTTTTVPEADKVEHTKVVEEKREKRVAHATLRRRGFGYGSVKSPDVTNSPLEAMLMKNCAEAEKQKEDEKGKKTSADDSSDVNGRPKITTFVDSSPLASSAPLHSSVSSLKKDAIASGTSSGSDSRSALVSPSPSVATHVEPLGTMDSSAKPVAEEPISRSISNVLPTAILAAPDAGSAIKPTATSPSSHPTLIGRSTKWTVDENPFRSTSSNGRGNASSTSSNCTDPPPATNPVEISTSAKFNPGLPGKDPVMGSPTTTKRKLSDVESMDKSSAKKIRVTKSALRESSEAAVNLPTGLVASSRTATQADSQATTPTINRDASTTKARGTDNTRSQVTMPSFGGMNGSATLSSPIASMAARVAGIDYMESANSSRLPGTSGSGACSISNRSLSERSSNAKTSIKPQLSQDKDTPAITKQTAAHGATPDPIRTNPGEAVAPKPVSTARDLTTRTRLDVDFSESNTEAKNSAPNSPVSRRPPASVPSVHHASTSSSNLQEKSPPKSTVPMQTAAQREALRGETAQPRPLSTPNPAQQRVAPAKPASQVLCIDCGKMYNPATNRSTKKCIRHSS
ncbi:hypothetical protein N0V82_004055 [Gnomoniopsis sp. IMI 355080]|nr:hypothetical protein N0V82_004055 [Gnomoniopsis sp. IMI 355080]